MFAYTNPLCVLEVEVVFARPHYTAEQIRFLDDGSTLELLRRTRQRVI